MKHPSILMTQAQIDYTAAMLDSQPWQSAFAALHSGGLPEAPNPAATATVHIPENQWHSIMFDAKYAYLNALCWKLNGSTANRTNAINILHSWAATLNSLTGVNAKLVAAWAGNYFINAAELLRSYPGWTQKGTFDSMLTNKFYNLLSTYKTDETAGYNGNWHASINQFVMSYGIYMDDQEIFDGAKNYSMGNSLPGSITVYLSSNGTTLETDRDLCHEILGFGAIAATAQIAKHQDVDLYGHASNRIMVAANGVASRVMAWMPNLQNYSLCYLSLSHLSGWEAPYWHYRSLGLQSSMPSVQSLVTATNFHNQGSPPSLSNYRPELYNPFGWGGGTLLYSYDTGGGQVPQVGAPALTPGAGIYATPQSVTISSATPGASIRYTTDGSTPTATTGIVYAGPVAVGSTTTLKAIAHKSGMSDSTVSTAAYTIGGSITVTFSSGFVNTSIAPLTGTFTFAFDAQPSHSPMDGIVAVALGTPAAYTDVAAIARFNASGTIDARDGGGYAAATTIPYAAGAPYHFRMVVNVPAHTYSLFVTPPGGSELTVGSNYAFRTEQSAVASLDTWTARVASTPADASMTVSGAAGP
jgi:hypothetical protein